MINKNYFAGIQALKNNEAFTLEQVAKQFPLSLAALLRGMTIPFETGLIRVQFSLKDYYKFLNAMEEAILTQNFDYIDNIILELIKSYHFKYGPIELTIRIPEVHEKTFIETCNNFKGKLWNKILDEFVEALYLLLNNTYLNNTKVNIGY